MTDQLFQTQPLAIAAMKDLTTRRPGQGPNPSDINKG
jgi:hypothetical protein